MWALHYKRKDMARRMTSIIIVTILMLNAIIIVFPLFLNDNFPNASGATIDPIFWDDMEAGGPASMGQWSVVDSVFMLPPQPSASRWEHGVPVPPPNAYSPTNVWGTELSGAYQNPTDCILVTPSIDLSYIDPEAIIKVELIFWHFYYFAANDGGWVEANPVPHNIDPQPLEPEGGYPGSLINPVGSAVPAFTGTNGAWEEVTIDISFRFQRTGHYLGFSYDRILCRYDCKGMVYRRCPDRGNSSGFTIYRS